MKIRVTLTFLLCTSILAGGRNTIETQWITSDSKIPEKKDSTKRFVPKHRVYEYSRSMEAVKVNLTTENRNDSVQITKPLYYSEAIDAEDFSNDLSVSHGVESGRSSQQLTTMRMNSKQPSQIFEVGFSHLGEKVLARHRKNSMEPALMALLMAYKMKFTALIPVLIGGLSLLVSTTALAGFFFALFAAVLGLKSH